MRRPAVFLAAVLLTAAAAMVFGADFGVSVDNDSTWERKEKDEDEFIQKNKLLLWFSHEFAENYEVKAVASGTLSNDDAEPTFYADVQQLSLKGLYPLPAEGISLFSFEAGRFYESEFTGRVFAHTMDGLRFELELPASTGRLSVGYTGLVNKYYGSIMMGLADAADDVDDDVVLASPRLLGSFSWEFSELFGRQSLTVAALVQMDMRSRVESSPLDEVDTQYFGLGLGGPLSPGFYYDLYGWAGTGDIMSYLVGGALRYYMPEVYFSAFSLKFLYAGGEEGVASYYGDYEGFKPIAGTAFGMAFAPKASNLAVGEISYSIKPWSGSKGSALESLQTALKATVFYKPVDGAISEGQADAAADAGYLGTELGAAVNYRPFSDLGMGLSLGVFVPGSGMFLTAYEDPWITGKLFISISF